MRTEAQEMEDLLTRLMELGRDLHVRLGYPPREAALMVTAYAKAGSPQPMTAEHVVAVARGR